MDRPNIIWLMFDSLRNEFLNEFGGGCPRNFVDNLIAKGISFTNCHSTAPFTIVSMASKMTSCYPSLNYLDGWLKENPIDTMNPLCLSFPEILRYNGYKTYYFSSSDSCAYVNPQGFDFYHAQSGYKDLPLLEYKEYTGPKFIYIDFGDLHDFCCNNAGRIHQDNCFEGILMTARVIESIYNVIKSNNDMVLLTSDHGMRTLDDFKGNRYENELITGRFLTEKTTRNSFNIIWEGKLQPQKYDVLCRGVDIMPTVLDLLGFEYPKLDGQTLMPLIQNQKFEEIKYSYSVTGWSSTHPTNIGAWCVRDKQYKYLITEHVEGLRRYKTYELFDYINNPEEDIDIKDEKPEKFKELEQAANNMFFTKRDINVLYRQQNFNILKYIKYRNEHLNYEVMDYANNIIETKWKKVVRPNFLKFYRKRKVLSIVYWQLHPIYALLAKIGVLKNNPDL